jgi:hypothetical protein
VIRKQHRAIHNLLRNLQRLELNPIFKISDRRHDLGGPHVVHDLQVEEYVLELEDPVDQVLVLLALEELEHSIRALAAP